ncbi:hypothetical protein PAMP_020523 [Pampus punctatissimus]
MTDSVPSTTLAYLSIKPGQPMRAICRELALTAGLLSRTRRRYQREQWEPSRSPERRRGAAVHHAGGGHQGEAPWRITGCDG